MPIRGLVFDLFGTLVTRGRGWRAYRELIYTLPLWRWRWARQLALSQSIPSITEFHARVGLRRGPGPEHFERLVAEDLADVRLFEDSIPALEQARARGLALALLSNLARPYLQPVFELGLDAYFDELVFSCEVGMAKPERALFEHVGRRLELPAHELLMIGDSRRDDIHGARAAGMHALHLDRSGKRGDLRGLDELFDHPLLTRL